MGLFDIFSSKKTNNNNSLDVLHGMDLREWNNGYKSDDKGIIKFIKDKLKSMTDEEFIKFLKNRDNYRKFSHQEANDEMNKLKVTEPKGMSSLGLTKFDWVFYPRILLERDADISGFKIVDSNINYQKDSGMKFEKGKTLVILRQNRNQKDLDYWKKKLSWEKTVHSVGFQFVDLDDHEYKFLKPFENKFKNKNYSIDMWEDFITNGFGSLFETEKRKAYPINRFQTYLVFEE
ncbi:MAG: hypothetical protein P8O81_01040 [Flavobacteriaceae bacterium]|nr:hypothetical protein [Flavobacteriaceae bacterium]